MRRLVLALALLTPGCVSCGHAGDARTIRQGVELVLDTTAVAAVRSLTPAESEQLALARAQLRELAERMEADAR